MRLFAAVQPPQPVLDHLESALASVRAATATGDPTDSRGALRWTTPEDRHLTLAFYGEVPEGLFGDVVAGLADVGAAAAPFEVGLRGAGVFDRRTLWVGCTGDTAALGRLMHAAVDVGRDVVGRVDDRVRSRAHLTVARVRPQARRPRQRGDRPDGRRDGRPSTDASVEVADLAHALAVYEGPRWTVTELVLVASELGAGPSGSARHEPVAWVPLSAVAG